MSRWESGAEEPWSICEAGWQVAVSEYVGRKERGGRGEGGLAGLSARPAAARVYTAGKV